jgi:hypothetical protein
MSHRILFLMLILSLPAITAGAQRVPNEIENIDYLITYGAQASTSQGDDDHVQILFFSVPRSYKSSLYIRVYDPDTGGTHDALTGPANTGTRFSIYGGKEAFSNKEAQKVNPIGRYNSGNLLASKVVGKDDKLNANWLTFGPFNPLQGEESQELDAYVFKFIAEGLEGDDGNQYRCFLSEKAAINRSIEGANAFAYEYTFSLPQNKGVSHIYPFIDKSVVSVTQNNFDLDNEGDILIYSIAKNRHRGSVSKNNEWAKSNHVMTPEEKNTTLDIQIQKNKEGASAMCLYITNQYDEAIPFFAIPIGGPPKYKYDLKVTLKPSIKN